MCMSDEGGGDRRLEHAAIMCLQAIGDPALRDHQMATSLQDC